MIRRVSRRVIVIDHAGRIVVVNRSEMAAAFVENGGSTADIRVRVYAEAVVSISGKIRVHLGESTMRHGDTLCLERGRTVGCLVIVV